MEVKSSFAAGGGAPTVGAGAAVDVVAPPVAAGAAAVLVDVIAEVVVVDDGICTGIGAVCGVICGCDLAICFLLSRQYWSFFADNSWLESPEEGNKQS